MASKPRKIVLTGATGFLGSHLMAALLARGERLIILGRAAGSTSLAKRIEALLSWFDLQPDKSLVEPVEADLLKPRCGLEQSRYQSICAETDLVLHCASDTAFSDHNRGQSLATNVTSLNSIILLAADCRASGFHYISTAYSVGITHGICLEKPVHACRFFNVYEETKAMAERKVAENCRAQGIPFTIIRPSIVYGDSRTGKANHFTALYHHVRALAVIRDIYLNDIRNNGGKKAAAQGISVNEQGMLHLPLRLALDKHGLINLIPVDYFVAAVLATIEAGRVEEIYHLTNGTSCTVDELARYCERFLGIRGLEITRSQNRIGQQPAEELFNRCIEPYRPYLSDQRTFSREHTNHVTDWLQPPVFSYDIFKRCMEYAVKVEWGKDFTNS
jgi:nucleoside-diphosphate-sugar epimerase